MPVGIEGNLDAGVAHLVANIGGGFALSDQLAREDVSQVMKARACHASLFCDRIPNLCVEFVRVYEAVAIARKDESAVRFADLQIGQHLHYASRPTGFAAAGLPSFWLTQRPPRTARRLHCLDRQPLR